MAFDREKTLQIAQKYIEKRKYDRAILEYQKVVQHEPNDARTLLRIGDLQARLGSHADAIATYDRVALYYAGRGFQLKAIAVLKQIGELIERHAPQLADQYGHVLPKLAQIYAELGLINDALSTYDAVARSLQNRGRDRDAVEIIRRMVSLDRANPLPYLRLAEALCRVSRVDEAIDHFWNAAQLLTTQARPEDALKVLERILHFRQDPRVARVAAQLYLTRKTAEAGMQALSRLQLCFEADPRDLETLTLLAQAFDVIGQPKKGIEVYKEMVRIALESGRKDLSERYLQHLLKVAPEDEQVRLLGAMRNTSPSERPPVVGPRSSSPPELSDDDIEFIDADAIAEGDDPVGSVRSLRPAEVAPIANATRRVESVSQAQLSSPPKEGADPGTLRPIDIHAGPAATEFLRKALVDAEGFRGLEQYTKASQCLRQALTVTPDSLELRAALEQVLLEAGDRPGAVEQMLALARLYVERGSLPAAEAELHQVLELVPDLPAARALLRQVEAAGSSSRESRGRNVVPESKRGGRRDEDPTPPQSQGEHEAFELRPRVSLGPQIVAAGTGGAPPVLEAPLPAYDLDEEDTSARTPAAPVASPPLQQPKAPLQVAAVKDAPLPQFTLDSSLHPPPSEGVLPPSSGRAPQRRESIRAALDEAEFFSSRGLYQDASMILRDRLDRYPGEAELIEAIASIEPKLTTESGTRDVGRLSESAEPTPEEPVEPVVATAARVAAVPPGPPSSALGKELRVQFSTDGKLEHGAVIDADADAALVDSLDQPEEQQVDVDEVFAKFKQGVKAQVSDSDSATHYDLGVAYKEMGLLADAAREFEIASRDPKRECTCLSMMGMMYRERGELDRAAEAYVRGLNAKHKTVTQEMSLYYDLGSIYEQKEDPDEAIYYYQRITRRDPSYRDVPQRLEALMPQSRRFSQPARPIKDDKDFDSHFDDLYERPE